ncbi:MAG TPA: hypothetical protein VN222_17300 [Novosphingobium sp.]|nr:hypothetical protein [Novosphingobium sp.]
MTPAARFLMACAAVALALPAGVAVARPKGPPGGTYGDPADLIATEIAFARIASEKGFAAAVKAKAAPDAQFIGPEGEVRAGSFDKAQAIPRGFAHRVIRQVWASCDGTYALTRGTYDEADVGKPALAYASLWQRQKKGDYRLVLDIARPGTALLAGDEKPVDFVEGVVADCPRRGTAPPPAETPDDPHALHDYTHGQSRDHTLSWEVGNGALTVSIQREGKPQVVLGAR